MGSGIAQVSTEIAKKKVVLLDTSLSRVENAKSSIGMEIYIISLFSYVTYT